MEKQKKRERERVKVVTRLPLQANLTPKRPPAERHLSVSPPLPLSSSSSSSSPHSGSRMQGGGSEGWRWGGGALHAVVMAVVVG